MEKDPVAETPSFPSFVPLKFLSHNLDKNYSKNKKTPMYKPGKVQCGVKKQEKGEEDKPVFGFEFWEE
ncbi:hypothetical protein AV530_000129 [Patagioenas fasciata monilis]|uniref:Uncharacterized protein n=1 Tax=Patagioenas fasciata monilis TaxID=372326 RepID=A0A1V4K049_PATFA|nr:hypothetical protein AV530_000129 [Patagioenas fasciata monilis]